MDTFLAISIVAVAGLWGASRLLRRFTRKNSSSCASCCGGCTGSVPSSDERTEGCGNPGDAGHRTGLAEGIPLPSRDDRRS